MSTKLANSLGFKTATAWYQGYTETSALSGLLHIRNFHHNSSKKWSNAEIFTCISTKRHLFLSLNNVELPEKDYDISICDDDYWIKVFTVYFRRKATIKQLSGIWHPGGDVP